MSVVVAVAAPGQLLSAGAGGIGVGGRGCGDSGAGGEDEHEDEDDIRLWCSRRPISSRHWWRLHMAIWAQTLSPALGLVAAGALLDEDVAMFQRGIDDAAAGLIRPVSWPFGAMSIETTAPLAN